ncbi:hypothetical protein [Bartonella koehlerae]|uniref:Uncharacterized protein n=2 Tax=Bartonella koehlerae TaxID=92181 RepID=A0A067WFB9_9HYPH|nr:hypothetical protein [Bartonella koehlerae]KEC55483.1 hypothetical protein O9A_00763 [Bartonella koehlerae C-29]
MRITSIILIFIGLIGIIKQAIFIAEGGEGRCDFYCDFSSGSNKNVVYDC